MRTELKKLHERLQATVVYVTHDQVEAMTMGDRIVVMKDGIVQQVGAPLELYNSPSNLFVAGFIGSPAMNFILCRLREKNSHIYIDAEDFKIPLPDSLAAKVRSLQETAFFFGIRPEDLRGKAPGQEPPGDSVSITANINVVEPLGKEISLDLSTGIHNLTALLAADTKAKPHEEIELLLSLKKIHLFKKEGGEAVF